MRLVQQAIEGPSLFGWYLGLIIGFTVVVVVVVIVASILTLAQRISRQAQAGTEALAQARVTTVPLWDLEKTNNSLKAILRSAKTARGALGG